MARIHQVIINTVLLVVPGVIITLGWTEKQWQVVIIGAVLLILGAFLIHAIDQKLATRLALARLHSKLHVPKEAELQSFIYAPGWVLRFMLGESARFPDRGQRRSKMLIYQGLVGRCFRANEIVKVVPNDGDYKERLVKEFGFTREDAVQFQTDRAAILCVPIPNAHGRVAGVLSLDAKQDVFTEELIKQIIDELALFYEALEVY
jgi:hypothetical protein